MMAEPGTRAALSRVHESPLKRYGPETGVPISLYLPHPNVIPCPSETTVASVAALHGQESQSCHR